MDTITVRTSEGYDVVSLKTGAVLAEVERHPTYSGRGVRFLCKPLAAGYRAAGWFCTLKSAASAVMKPGAL